MGTSALTTLAPLTMTLFPISMILSSPPWRVFTVMPLLKSLLKAVLGTTWYFKTLASWSLVSVLAVVAIAAKASLVGAKMVTSLRPSTVVARQEVTRESTRLLRPAALAVTEAGWRDPTWGSAAALRPVEMRRRVEKNVVFITDGSSELIFKWYLCKVYNNRGGEIRRWWLTRCLLYRTTTSMYA